MEPTNSAQGSTAFTQTSPHEKSVHRAAFKRFYVRVLLALLPTLLKVGRVCSSRMAAETAYQNPGFSFGLTVQGTKLSCAAECTGKSWRRLPRSSAATSDYVIDFRDVDYAFAVFSGSMSLQDALAARLFTTRGANNTGVSLTYMFTVLLHAFFFWRSAYRG